MKLLKRKALGRPYSSTASRASNVVEKIGGTGRRSPGEESFALQLTEAGIEYTQENRLIADRKFRVDFLIGKDAVIEIEGQTWRKGGHSSGVGIIRDMEKYNLLAALGYKVFRFTTEQATSGEALKWLREYVTVDDFKRANPDELIETIADLRAKISALAESAEAFAPRCTMCDGHAIYSRRLGDDRYCEECITDGPDGPVDPDIYEDPKSKALWDAIEGAEL